VKAVASSYWSELATEEKALFEFDPMSRRVPTTITKITASMTAYSAMSCPRSSVQSRRRRFDMGDSFFKDSTCYWHVPVAS
jgi:hypothetical protein